LLIKTNYGFSNFLVRKPEFRKQTTRKA